MQFPISTISSHNLQNRAVFVPKSLGSAIFKNFGLSLGMEYTNVFLHYGGKWAQNNEYTNFMTAGILVPRGCTYNMLVEMIYSELELDQTMTDITIKYQVKEDVPLMKIKSDNNVMFYLELKRKDQGVATFPLCIDTSPVTESNRSDTNHEVQHLDHDSAVTGLEMLKSQPPERCYSTFKAPTRLPTVEDIAFEVSQRIPDVDKVFMEAETSVIMHPTADRIEKGQIFSNKKVMMKSIALYAIENRFQFRVKRSDKKEYVVKCEDANCQWSFRASKVRKTDKFKIRYISNEHTCSLDVILRDHRQASSSMVASCIMYKYTSSKTKYTPGDIINDMMNEYGVSLSYGKAWRAQEQANVELRGDPEESYGKLPTYLYRLEVTNQGSVTGLETDSRNMFKYAFVALGASLQGWGYCRPIIAIDGTSLKGYYGGTLFTAYTQDANNNIYVLAFGVGDSQNDNSWEWFLTMMKASYGERESLCFVSDTRPSIENAIRKVYPNAMHAVGSYHLLHNLKTTFDKSKNMTDPFNAAARAYTTAEFEHQMTQLDKIHSGIRPYLDKIGYHRWSRAYMTNNRFSVMMSNIVESVKVITKSAKTFPIEYLLEFLRCILQNWFCKNRDDALKTSTNLASKYECMLQERSSKSVKIKVSASSEAIYHVSDATTSHLVNIQERTCSCNRFQMDEIPCVHALSVITERNLNSYDYCSKYYTKESYIEAYRGTIFPLGNRDDWIVPDDVGSRIVLPPIPKRKSEMSEEKRVPSRRERRQVTKCGGCGAHGHNRRTCNNQTPLKPKRKRKLMSEDL